MNSDAGAIVIRRARPADAAAIARVHVETWQAAYAGLIPDRVLLAMTEEGHRTLWAQELQRPAPRTFVLVAADDGAGVVAFGTAGPARAGTPYRGEIYMLYVHPDHQGRGIGRRLMGRLFAGLCKRDMNSALVWVLAMNPSRFFYEAMGGTRVARRRERLWGALLPELAYGWPRLESVADDAGA